MSFAGKVVVVTGASSGIGAAIAVKFAEEGANVSLVGRNMEKLITVSKKCKNSLVIIADVSKEEDAHKLVDKTIKRFGQIDVLINNAGIIGVADIDQENAINVFDKVMSTNLRAAVLVTTLAVPHLVKTEGNIINMSSIAGLRSWPKASFAYNTSKAALDHFSRSIALELAPKRVRVNTVNPGPVRTDIIENLGVSTTLVDATFEMMKGITALKRVSNSEEVADLVVFLASDKARAITGSAFVTDNGALIA